MHVISITLVSYLEILTKLLVVGYQWYLMNFYDNMGSVRRHTRMRRLLGCPLDRQTLKSVVTVRIDSYVANMLLIAVYI